MRMFSIFKRKSHREWKEYGAVERKVGPRVPRVDGKPPGIRPGQSVRVKGKTGRGVTDRPPIRSLP